MRETDGIRTLSWHSRATLLRPSGKVASLQQYVAIFMKAAESNSERQDGVRLTLTADLEVVTDVIVLQELRDFQVGM